MCQLHEMAWFYPAVSETSKLQKQKNWEGKAGKRLYAGGHEHSEREQKFIDWLGGGITTSHPVEGDERVEAEWCEDLESSEVPLLEFEAGRNLQETETSDKVVGDRLRTPTHWKCQRTWDKGLNAEGAFSWPIRGQQGIFQRNPLKFKKCVFVGRENEDSVNNYVWLLLTTSLTMNHSCLLSIFYFFPFITFIFHSLVLFLFLWKILQRQIWISSNSLYGFFPFHSIFTLWLVHRFVSGSYDGMVQLGKIQTEAQNRMLLIKINAMGSSAAVAAVYEVS